MPCLVGLRAMQRSIWSGVVRCLIQASWQRRASSCGEVEGAMSMRTRGTIVMGIASKVATSSSCGGSPRWMTIPGRLSPARVGTVISAIGGGPEMSRNLYAAARWLSTVPGGPASTAAM